MCAAVDSRRDVDASYSRTAIVSWTAHHRARGIAAALDASIYEPTATRASWPAPIRYVVEAAATLLHVLRVRPSHVLFTDPPFVTGIVLLALRPLFRFDVWPDAHSGAFNDPRWIRFARIHRWMLRRCEQAIIASPSLADAVQEAGARPLILNYPWTEAKLRREATSPAIVATLGYRFDEPVAELLAAARSIPHVRFVLTGNAPPRVRAEAPPNCRVTGWLGRGDYEDLLAEARGVICLTTREDTMQTGAYEAVQYGLPMVLSGTAALRRLFGPGVVFVDDHTPETLAAASTLVWEEHERLAAEAAGAREHLLQQFRVEVDGLRDAVRERDRA